MKTAPAGSWLLPALVAVAVLAYAAARYWQTAQPAFARSHASGSCDLRAGACRAALGSGAVVFSIVPHGIPLMTPLRLRVETPGLDVHDVRVEMRGVNMDMGLNRTRLQRLAPAVWIGETILPVCSRSRMQWEAGIRLDAAEPVEVVFDFHTLQP